MKENNNTINSIEAIYFTPSQIIEKKTFSPKVKFKEIIDYFYSNIQINNKNLELKKNYYHKQNQLNESTNIIDFYGDIDANIDGIINIYIELNDINDNQDNMSYILKPKNNPFGIIIYSVKSNSFSSEIFKDDVIKAYNLEKYHPTYSAYCNSYDTLFISGGIDRKKDPTNDFWVIKYIFNDGENLFEIKQLKMPYNKEQHSMIYNKINNSIIFVGGNDQKCFVYDINNNNFYNLPDINSIYIKPALIIKNNTLYVFDSFDKKKMFFEKLNLEKNDNFEKFFPKDYSLYNNRSFGVCNNVNNNEIIFLGGERNEQNTIIYDINNNNIIKSKGKDIYGKLDDKNFYKINQIYYGNIPDSTEKCLIIINSKTKDANKIIFDSNGKTNFNFDENDQSDISIEPITHNIVLNENNNLSNDQKLNYENLKENEIFFEMNNDKNFINDGSIEIKLRSHKNKLNINSFKGDTNNNNDNNNQCNMDNADNDFGNLVLNVEEDMKERDNEEKIYKLYHCPKFFVSGTSINDQFTNISMNREEEKNENQIKNQKEINKLKFPINIKLNQSQMVIRNKMIMTDSSLSNSDRRNNMSHTSRNISRSVVYLNDDMNLNDNNKDYNNYKFYEMKPNYKTINKSEILNITSKSEPRIKNPFLKERIIKKKEINGLKYSIICEKIIDKNNRQYFDSINLKENLALENEYGNHKLYISHYTDGNASFPDNLEDLERRTLQPIKYRNDIEKFNKTERNYNNISSNFNKYYNDNSDDSKSISINNDKNNNNNLRNNKINKYSEKKKHFTSRNNSNLNDKSIPIKANIKYNGERKIEATKIPEKKIDLSKDNEKFEATKTTTDERKFEINSTPEDDKEQIKLKNDSMKYEFNNITVKNIVDKKDSDQPLINKDENNYNINNDFHYLNKEPNLANKKEVIDVVENSLREDENEKDKLKSINNIENNNKNKKSNDILEKNDENHRENEIQIITKKNSEDESDKSIKEDNYNENENERKSYINNYINYSKDEIIPDNVISTKNILANVNKIESVDENNIEEDNNNNTIKENNEKQMEQEIQLPKILNSNDYFNKYDKKGENNEIISNEILTENDNHLGNTLENENMEFKIENNENQTNNNTIKDNDNIDDDKEINTNTFKKKKTKLINIDADNNEKDKKNENYENITFGDENQLIFVENTLEEKEEMPMYKKKSSLIQFLLPSNAIAEQILKREILENKDNNIARDEANNNENISLNENNNTTNPNEDQIKVKIIYENKTDENISNNNEENSHKIKEDKKDIKDKKIENLKLKLNENLGFGKKSNYDIHNNKINNNNETKENNYNITQSSQEIANKSNNDNKSSKL